MPLPAAAPFAALALCATLALACAAPARLATTADAANATSNGPDAGSDGAPADAETLPSDALGEEPLDSATVDTQGNPSDAKTDLPMDAPLADKPDTPTDLAKDGMKLLADCGDATAEECARCGNPPAGQLLCHQCPYHDPPPKCYAVCSASTCYECSPKAAGAWGWDLNYYDCTKSDGPDASGADID